MTRSIGAEVASASGFIDPSPKHWAIESYIPIDPRELVEYLVRQSSMTLPDVDRFRAMAIQIREGLSHEMVEFDRKFDRFYHDLDPDLDSRRPVGLAEPDGAELPVVDARPAIDLCREILHLAGYREVDRPEIEACVGVASQWGVPLDVDFSLFSQLVVYCRGDIIGNRVRRRLRKFYRLEAVEVPIYQRMVVIFQLAADAKGEEELLSRRLHLRMFKNIPKLDIDMLLPCTRVKFTWLDRLKILLPSVGGVLMSARKIANTLLIVAVLTLKSTFLIAGLVIGVISYIVRSVLGYFQTKNRYLLNLTRNLYFQKLDTNAGVGYCLIHQAHEQATTETVLGYYALMTAGEPLSDRKWQRRCERLVREAIDVEVDVNISRVARRLESLGLVARDEAAGRFTIAQTATQA